MNAGQFSVVLDIVSFFLITPEFLGAARLRNIGRSLAQWGERLRANLERKREKISTVLAQAAVRDPLAHRITVFLVLAGCVVGWFVVWPELVLAWNDKDRGYGIVGVFSAFYSWIFIADIYPSARPLTTIAVAMFTAFQVMFFEFRSLKKVSWSEFVGASMSAAFMSGLFWYLTEPGSFFGWEPDVMRTTRASIGWFVFGLTVLSFTLWGTAYFALLSLYRGIQLLIWILSAVLTALARGDQLRFWTFASGVAIFIIGKTAAFLAASAEHAP